MMREFKFRAFHEESGKMLYGEPSNVFQWADEGQPVHIMQWTGYQDKNGVDIYEGDIMGDGRFTHEVVFKEMKFSTPAQGANDDYSCVGFERKIYFGDICYWSVIGNIHENKDLLK